MSTKHRLGISLGILSIAFSTLCLIVMPVFTGAMIAALLLGVAFGAMAASLGARRTAGVTLLFALAPLFGFFVMENSAAYFRTGYVAFAPFLVAIVVAVWVATNYLRTKRA